MKSTFQYLKKTENEAAVELLIDCLDTKLDVVRGEALRTLLERPSPAGHRAVLARLARMPKSDLAIVSERPDRMARAIADTLGSADAATCGRALEAVLTFRLYEIMPTLTAILRTPDNPLFLSATRIIDELTDLFYMELSGQTPPEPHRDYDMLRSRLTTTLEEAAGCYSVHQSREVLEAFLTLAKPQNVILRRILQQPDETVHAPLIEVMKTSQRGGVIRLLLSFLEDPQMPNTARNVLATREDVKFLDNLAAHVGPRPTKVLVESLATFRNIGWAQADHPVFEQLGDATQENLVTVLLHSGIKRGDLLTTLGHILLRGKPGGRRAAARAMVLFQEPLATEFIRSALADEDPDVLAALVPQLRQRKIPGALSLMMQLVDVPHMELRAALGKSMPEFTFRQFMSNFDSMPEELLPTTGHLVRKIDLRAKKELVAELEGLSPVRRRKAVQAAAAMGMVRTLEQQIIARLSDDDHMVRIAAAKALAGCDSMPSWEALRDALLDKSVIVQEAAEASLMRITQGLTQVRTDESAPDQETLPQEVLR
ncbi:MAG: HEAT repeat domain-containing protein [Thermoguttaceae bacterium]